MRRLLVALFALLTLALFLAFSPQVFGRGTLVGPAPLALASTTPCSADWQTVSSPNVPGSSNTLSRSAAVAANDVWAVGSAGNQTLSEHWDGTQWQIVPSPNPGSVANHLQGVAALATNDVWAVGYSNSGGADQTLVEHWNGVAWTVVPSPNAASGDSVLRSVAAVSAGDIWAAGYTGYPNAYQSGTLIEHWNGTQWSIVASPSMGPGNNPLNSVSAVATNDVWAVGENDPPNGGLTQTLIEHWNGSAWQLMPTTGPGTFVGSAARASTDVWAVGFVGNYGSYQTYVAHWDGSQWSHIASPNSGAGNNYLTGVVALAAGDAWAVGWRDPSGGSAQAMIQHWDGSQWTLLPNSSAGSLFGLSAVNSTDVWAVGFGGNPASYQTLVEHYTSQCVASTPTVAPTQTAIPATPTSTPAANCTPVWSQVPSHNVPPGANLLKAVAVVSANDIWAVGGANNQTLIEHWNGSTWDLIPSPSPGTVDNQLFAVGAVSTNDVWAGGYYSNASGTDQALLEHWNGSQWSVAAVPPGWSFNGIAALAGNDVWAVGTIHVGTDAHTLAAHWDGTTWTVVPSPNLGSGLNSFDAISAINTHDIWAVGYVDPPNGGLTQALEAHWDGTQWQMLPSIGAGVLLGAAASGSNDVWAVGFVGNYGFYQTLTAHWDGSTWNHVNSPNYGPGNNDFNAVAAVAGNDVWAVGQNEGNGLQTIIEHWTGSQWTLVPNTDPGQLIGIAAVNAANIWAVGRYGNSPNYLTLVEHYASPCTTPNPTATPPHPSATATAAHPTATATPTHPMGTTTPGPSCQFAILSFHSCIDDHGCVSYAIPLQNTGDTAIVVDGSVSLQARGGIEIGHATIPATTLAPHSVTMVNGQVCGVVDPHAGPFSLQVTIQDIPRLCDQKTKRQPVRFCDPAPALHPFADVPSSHPFYAYIGWLAAYDLISGYACGAAGEPCDSAHTPYFRPAAPVTRGQVAKIVANSAGFADAMPADQQTFADVPPSNPFWLPIEELAQRGILGGYACGGRGEPCDAAQRHYFRPAAGVTRGQLTKIIANTVDDGETAAGQTFEDVPPGSAFYGPVQIVAGWGSISGYGCNAGSMPCVQPADRPYFLPNQPITRAQMAKILANSFIPDPSAPLPAP